MTTDTLNVAEQAVTQSATLTAEQALARIKELEAQLELAKAAVPKERTVKQGCCEALKAYGPSTPAAIAEVLTDATSPFYVPSIEGSTPKATIAACLSTNDTSFERVQHGVYRLTEAQAKYTTLAPEVELLLAKNSAKKYANLFQYHLSNLAKLDNDAAQKILNSIII